MAGPRAAAGRPRNLLIEGGQTPQASARATSDSFGGGEPSAHRFALGDRVFHQKFGNGNVLAVDGDKLRIAFDHAGEKMVIASFVRPA